MRCIDLHVHSTASDGTVSPKEIVSSACSQSLSAIALTDHDTVSGISEALEAAHLLSEGGLSKHPVEVIPGIELSCMYHKTEIHIIGLFIDSQSPYLLKRLQDIRQTRDQRNQDMIKTFNQHDIAITIEELTEGNENTVITRAHFARLLLKKGYVSSMQKAFNRYLSYDGPFCQRKEELSCSDAIAMILKSGGVPILAHPLLYKMGYPQIEDLVNYLIPLGLSGIEVYHSSNNKYSSEKLNKIAGKYQLLVSGGSDYHGDNKPDIKLGVGRGNLQIPYRYLEAIRNSL